MKCPAYKIVLFLKTFFLFVILISLFWATGFSPEKIEQSPSYSANLLTDPFLQMPTEDSVRVVWFTEFKGTSHWVDYGTDLEKRANAVSTRMTRLREDQESHVKGSFDEIADRLIWRHEALVSGLPREKRLPYRVVSVKEASRHARSEIFTLQAKPRPGTPLKILLTSDHQSKPMTAANLQKVEEIIGRVDAVFMAGDLVHVSDRASEWFDDERGSSFFPALQGRGHFALKKEDGFLLRDIRSYIHRPGIPTDWSLLLPTCLPLEAMFPTLPVTIIRSFLSWILKKEQYPVTILTHGNQTQRWLNLTNFL